MSSGSRRTEDDGEARSSKAVRGTVAAEIRHRGANRSSRAGRYLGNLNGVDQRSLCTGVHHVLLWLDACRRQQRRGGKKRKKTCGQPRSMLRCAALPSRSGGRPPDPGRWQGALTAGTVVEKDEGVAHAAVAVIVAVAATR